MIQKKSGGFSKPSDFYIQSELSELRTGSYERLAEVVACELLEVLDETSCKVFSLLIPLCRLGISVARIEDGRIHTRELCRNFEIEVRDLLGRSLLDRTVEDSIDNTAGITDRDTLACSVPACVHEISLGAYCVHSLHEFLTVFCRVE